MAKSLWIWLLKWASGVTLLHEDIFICGITNRNISSTHDDILLLKLNSTGDTLWTKHTVVKALNMGEI